MSPGPTVSSNWKNYRIPMFKRPPGLYILQKICKKTSYYFVNFCLKKNNLGAWRGGAFIRGGGALNLGYTVHMFVVQLVSASMWR